MAEFSFYAGNPDSDNYEVATLFRHNLYAGSISELAIARGIYNYNLCQFEQSLSTSDIQPPDDRYHPMYIVNQKLHLITDVALCIFVAYLSTAVWHANNLRNLIGLPILVAVYALWTFALYPLFKYRKIKASIRKLNAEHKIRKHAEQLSCVSFSFYFFSSQSYHRYDKRRHEKYQFCPSHAKSSHNQTYCKYPKLISYSI